MRIARRSAAGLVVALLALLATAVPVSAQQLVDASEKGDVAFDVFAVMCILFVVIMFAIDRVRHRGDE